MGLVIVITLWYFIVSRAVFAAVFDHYNVSWSEELSSLAPLWGEFLFVYVVTTAWLEKHSRG